MKRRVIYGIIVSLLVVSFCVIMTGCFNTNEQDKDNDISKRFENFAGTYYFYDTSNKYLDYEYIQEEKEVKMLCRYITVNADSTVTGNVSRTENVNFSGNIETSTTSDKYVPADYDGEFWISSGNNYLSQDVRIKNGVMTITDRDNGSVMTYKMDKSTSDGANNADIFVDEQGLLYAKNDNEYCVSAFIMQLDKITIPATYNGLKVSKIGRGAASYKKLGEIELGANIKSIGSDAFLYSDITKINFPSSLESVGERAFENTKNLTEAILPDSLNINGVESLFYGSSITNVKLPAGTTEIGKNAFCTSKLEKIDLDGVTKIGESAFYETNITELELPSTLAIMENDAFRFCDKLEKVIINENAPLTVLNEHVFSQSYGKQFNLTYMELPKALTSVNANVFGFAAHGSSALVVKVNVAAEIAHNDAFKRCAGIIVPDASAESYSEWHFNVFKESQVNYDTRMITEGDKLLKYFGNEEKPTLPGGIKKIGESAFRQTSVKEITVPNGITEIGRTAFEYSQLLSIKIPKSVISIGYDAFKSAPILNEFTKNDLYVVNGWVVGCGIDFKPSDNWILDDGIVGIANRSIKHLPSVETIDFGETLMYIGESNFIGYDALTTVTFGANLKILDRDAFYICDLLTTVNYTGDNNTWSHVLKNSEKINSLTVNMGYIRQ